ncbi:MAG TPA: hypothetical protein VGR78_18725 [Verrucomicrobiae bacterium]|nr:hypothetical protein [Verrucomicrobiae bacterium]
MKTIAIDEENMDAKDCFQLLGKLNGEMTELHHLNQESDMQIEKLLPSKTGTKRRSIFQASKGY